MLNQPTIFACWGRLKGTHAYNFYVRFDHEGMYSQFPTAIRNTCRSNYPNAINLSTRFLENISCIDSTDAFTKNPKWF